MTVLVVIAYDTPDDRRRSRMADRLEGYGERVQDSVFECWLDVARLAALKSALESIADPEVDRIRYYRLCRKDIGRVFWEGRGDAPRDHNLHIL